jgi:hypothetical protein
MAKQKQDRWANAQSMGLDALEKSGFRFNAEPEKMTAPEAPTVAPRGVMGAMKDVGISALKGAIGLPEAAVGLADIATGGRVGKALEGVGYEPGRARAILDDNLTDAQKAANAELQNAEGFTGKLAAAIENPSVIGQTIVESAPSMLGGAAVGRGLVKLAPKMGAVFGAAAGEGVVGAGQAAEQIRTQTPDRLLTPEQSMAAAVSGLGTAVFGVLGGKVAQRLGIGDVDTMLAQASLNPVARKGVVRAALEGAVSEGVLEELPQSIQEQVWQNQALGKPLSDGVDEAAVLGLLSGGAMGGVAGPLSSSKAGDPIRDLKTGGTGTLARAADTGLEHQAKQADAGISDGQLNAAMTAMEGQAAEDQKGIKAAGRADKTGFAGQPTPKVGMAQAMGVMGDIGSTEEVSALTDRIMGVKESLADPTTRDFIRQNLGEEAFNEATYYANQADRPGAIPDQTRENMLALAEAIVSRARLTPIQQPGALGANVGAAPEALAAPQGVPAIGLDTTPTGTMRVDSQGNAAPEVNADAISTRQAQAERDVLGAQARRASAAPADPAPKAPAPPAAIGYDTTPTGVMRVDSKGGARPETRADQINAKQAQPVRDDTLGQQARKASAVWAEPAPKPPAAPKALPYDTSPTGRMVAGPDGVTQETNAERINRQQVRSVQPGDRTRPNGQPFKNKPAALTEQRRAGGAVVEVDGGWVVRAQAEDANQAPAAPGNQVAIPQKLNVTFGGKTYPVESIADAQRKWIDFQNKAGAGVSEVGNGVRIADQDGKFVARISFNGRVWDAEGDNANLIAEAPSAAPAPAPKAPEPQRAPAFLRKTLPEMTDEELSQAGQFYGADHPRASKVKQEVSRRARKAAAEAKRKPKPEPTDEQDAPQAPSTPTQTKPGEAGSDPASTGTPGAGETQRVSRSGDGADEAGGVKPPDTGLFGEASEYTRRSLLAMRDNESVPKLAPIKTFANGNAAYGALPEFIDIGQGFKVRGYNRAGTVIQDIKLPNGMVITRAMRPDGSVYGQAEGDYSQIVEGRGFAEAEKLVADFFTGRSKAGGGDVKQITNQAGAAERASNAPGKATAKAPKPKSHPPTVRGSRALAAISRSLGGLSPDLLPDLSEKVQRTRVSKAGKKTQYTVWDNPAIPGIGPLFRTGGTSDLSEVARVLEDGGYLTAGSVEADPIGATQRAEAIIKAELREGGSTVQIGDADAIDAEMPSRQEAQADQPDPWDDFTFEPEDLDATGYSALNPDTLAATEQLIAEAEAMGIDTEAIRDDTARIVGDSASQEEYHAATQEAIRQAIAQTGRNAEQVDASGAREGNQGGRSPAEQAGREGGQGQRDGGSDQEGLSQPDWRAEVSSSIANSTPVVNPDQPRESAAGWRASVERRVGKWGLVDNQMDNVDRISLIKGNDLAHFYYRKADDADRQRAISAAEAWAKNDGREPLTLTAPTRADIEAQQDRAEQADTLDAKAQAKRESEVGDSTFMTGFTGDGRQDNTADLFAQAAEPEAPKIPQAAQDHAAQVGGRVAWHEGDIALIEGYSILSGDPVYTAAKGTTRTMVDIRSYTGAGFTVDEKRKLLAARAEAVKEAEQELARNPDGPFKAGRLVFADDISPKVAEVAKGWVDLLDLGGVRIVVTTPASGKTMAEGMAGRFRRIGKANLSGDNTHGVMQPLGEGDYHVAIRPQASTLKTLEVLAHELGHIAERHAFASADEATKQAIRAAHEQWLQANGKGKAVDMARSMRAYRTGLKTGFGNDAMAKDASSYWKSFGEWFADQVSRWATTDAKPLTVVDQFFSRLGKALRSFFTGERESFKPTGTMADWLNSLSKDVAPIDAAKESPQTVDPKKPWALTQDEFVQAVNFKKDGPSANPWSANWGDTPLDAANEEFDHPLLGKTVVGGGRFFKTKREAEVVARGAHKRAVRRALMNGEAVPTGVTSAYPDLAEQQAKDRQASTGGAADATSGGSRSAPGGPRIIGRVGKTPNSAHDVELKANKDGTLTPWVEGYELLDFNSGDPVKVAADASDAEVLKAMRESGALSRGAKFYPAKDAADGAAGFSRQPEDESFYRSQVDYEWAPPSVVNRVKQQVESLRTFWKNSPEVVVLASFSDAPEAMQRLNDQQMESGAVGEPEGFFYKGKAYLLAPHMKGPADVRRVLFHETLGHLGLRGVFGDGLNPILDQLWATRRKEVQAKADSYGLDTSKQNARRMAAEEVLAEMAQDRPEIGFVRRAVAIVKQWLRKNMPGFAGMKMSDDEIVSNFLIPARQFIERGRGAQGQQLVPAFSRVDAEESGFSRGATQTRAAADLRTQARNAFTDFVGSAGAKVDWLDKSLKTQYAKAQRFPEFGKVFDKLQEYTQGVSSFANQAADQAPDILPKLDSFKDLMREGPASLLRHGLSQEDVRALSAPVFEGTLNWARDAQGELVETEDPASAGVVFTDSELRDKFSLSDKQIKHYRQFRAAVDESLDQVVAADIIRLLGAKAPASIKALANTIDGRASLREALRQTFANSPDEAMQAIWADQIAPKYDHVASMKAKGYAPLSRFGKFFVHVTDKATGETVYFGMEETQFAANRRAREMREEFGAGNEVSQGLMSQKNHELMSDVPLDSLEMFASAIGAEKTEVFQKYIQLAKNNRSTLKHLIKRKGRKGFSMDAPRVLASFLTSNARASAAAVNLLDAKELAKDIADGDVKDEAIDLIKAVTEPQESGAAVRGLMFTNFIGGSIASAVVNMTQPIMMTLPYLSQWGGITKAGKRLVSAAGMAVSGKIADSDLAKALKQAEDEGIVAPQEIHHLLKQATGTAHFRPEVDAAIQKLAFVWSTPFALAESFNRKASFIAAYQTAKAESIADPYAFALKAVTETQGLYNAGNKPNAARGVAGATVMTFKQYSIHYLEWLARMAKNGPEGKKAALWAIALLVMAAGGDGLPFSEDLNDIIDTVGQAMGYDANSKRWRHEVVADAFGPEMAEVLSRGLSASAGFPVDLSLRMGMGNLLPATDILKLSNTDTARSLAEIAGPGGALFTQYKDALKLMLSGEAGGAALKMAPNAIQNLGKAAKMMETGEYRDSKDRKVMDVDGADAAMKALSFQPAQIARESAKMSENRQSEVLAKTVEAEITDAWARALVDGDAQAQEDARQRLLDWNEKNPEMPIRINRAQIATKAQKMRQSRAERYIKTVAPERRAAAKQEMSS